MPERNDTFINLRFLTPDIADKIRREYTIFAKKSRKRLVLDKLPTHSFNIPILQKGFSCRILDTHHS